MDAETLEQVKRHFNFATEALRSEFRAVTEAVAGQGEELRREFVAVRAEIEEGLRARLERVESRIGG